jgi:hypothetical protein
MQILASSTQEHFRVHILRLSCAYIHGLEGPFGKSSREQQKSADIQELSKAVFVGCPRKE